MVEQRGMVVDEEVSSYKCQYDDRIASNGQIST